METITSTAALGADLKANHEMLDDFKSIEAIIDNSSLANVLAIVSRICHEKAEHIEVNWQDKELAKCWTRMAGRIATQALSAEDVYRV